MKKLFLFVLIFAASVQAQWKTLLEPRFSETVNDIYFTSSTEGFLATDSMESCIYKTIDAGKTWSPVSIPNVYDAEEIAFNGLNGWIFGAFNNVSFMSTSTDGGQNWSESSIDAFKSYKVQKNWAFSFPSANVGYGVVSAKFPPSYSTIYYYVIKTADGGKTWTKQDSVAATGAVMTTAVAFYDENKGVMVGNKKARFKYTEDGGATWKAATMPDDRTIMAVKWLDANTVIACGDGFSATKIATPVYKSTDAGKTWTSVSPVGYNKARVLHVKSSTEAMLAGIGEKGGVFVAVTTDAGNTWTVDKEAGYPYSITGLGGTGSNVYALSSGNQIVQTTDFGAKWDLLIEDGVSIVQRILPVGNTIYSLNAAGEFYAYDKVSQKLVRKNSTGITKAGDMLFTNDAVNGIMVKENRSILGTTNSGEDWHTVVDTIAYNANNKAFNVSFPDEKHGFAMFNNTTTKNIIVMATDNGGNSWTEVNSSTLTNSPSGIVFLDSLKGIIYGSKLSVLLTSDGGKTWTDAVLPTELTTSFSTLTINDAAASDENTVFFVAEGIVFKTTDKGATYSIVNVNPATGADTKYYAVAFDGNKGIIASYNGSIFQTTDGGSSWTTDLTYNGKALLYAAAIGEEGTFVGTSKGEVFGADINITAVENNIKTVADYKLYNSYPNPFNPSTVIRFSLPKTENVTVTIYNAIGKEVARLIDGKSFSAGEHTVNFNAGNLATGLYLCRMQAGSFTAVNKLMLIK